MINMRNMRLVSLGLLLAVILSVPTGCTKQARKQRALTRAERDLAAEKYERAEIEFLTALRVPPPSAKALIQLGRIYYAQGKYPQSYAYLQKVLELQPDDAAAHAQLAKTLLSLGRPRESRAQALLALQKEPGNAEGLFALVETTVSTNQLAETTQKLEATAASLKNDAGYHVARGALHLRLRELDKAETEFNAAIAASPKSSEAYFALGNLYLARTNVVEAEKALKRAAELAPARSTTRLMYADLKVRTGQPDAARKMVEELTSKAPDFLPGWVYLARMDYAERKIDQCGKTLEKVLGRDPINIDALMLKGESLMAQGDPTNAVAPFERILSTYGKNPVVQYKIAVARVQSRETAKALSMLNDILSANTNFVDAILLKANLQTRNGNANSAIDSLTKLVKERPEIFQAHAALAEAYLSQKALDKAVAVYQGMRSAFPRSAEVPLVLGSLLMQQGKNAEARKAFEDAVQMAPDNLLAQEKLIDLDLTEQAYEKALKRARGEQERKPKAAEPWLLAAKVHMAQALHGAGITNAQASAAVTAARLAASPASQAEVKEAEGALLKAIELNPEFRPSYMLLAQVYVATGRQQQAIDRLSVLANTNDLGALMQVALLQTELKNYGAARETYERALKANPQLGSVLNNLAFLYCEHLGQPQKALEVAEKARKLLPDDPRAADTLGWVLYNVREYGRALPLLQEGGRQLLGDPEVQFHLGMTHYMLGEEQPARTALQKALSAGPDTQWRPEADKRLRILNTDPGALEAGKLPELKQSLAGEKDDPIAQLRLAAANERTGNYREARECYEGFLKKHPQNSAAQIRLARILAQQLGEPSRALELAKQAHSIAPEDGEITYTLGELAYRNKDYAWALSLLQEAGRKLPDRPDVSYDLGWAFYACGRCADAEKAMQTAVGKLAGEDLEKSKTFLSMLGAVKDPSAVKAKTAEMDTCLQKDPSYVPALHLKAVAMEDERNFAAAAKAYEQVLGIFPLFRPATKRLAGLYAFSLGDDKRAYELAAKARDALPQDPEVARTLGILCCRRAEYDRGVMLLRESLRTRAEDAEAQFYLGMAYYRLKQSKEATQALQRALDLNLDGKQAEEARRAIGEMALKP